MVDLAREDGIIGRDIDLLLFFWQAGVIELQRETSLREASEDLHSGHFVCRGWELRFEFREACSSAGVHTQGIEQ